MTANLIVHKISFTGSTEFGLASQYHSRDMVRASRMAEALKAGIAGINR